jgi:phosphoadenosine phosphosulfate reductase
MTATADTGAPLQQRENVQRDARELRELAAVHGPELELAPAEAIIEWAVTTFGERFCITSSMADGVLAHLASRVAPGIDVVFLDTGYHFAETIGKVEPLIRGLAEYDAWATGLRREETRSRVIAPVVGWDDQKQKVKVSPLARWTQDDVDRYITENDVLVNPLQYDGYPSIGCWPCTSRVAPGDDPRSGRWSGFAKTECGIHTDGRSAS